MNENNSNGMSEDYRHEECDYMLHFERDEDGNITSVSLLSRDCERSEEEQEFYNQLVRWVSEEDFSSYNASAEGGGERNGVCG